MILRKLREFLDQQQVKYVVISHSLAYTSQEIAQAAHVHGEQFAKTAIVKLDGELAMAVVPAPQKVDWTLLGAVARARKAELASENDFRGRFPECELGAMPPFGNLFDMHVYIDEALMKEKNLAFNAGSHTELVQMAVADFARLVKPRIARISAAYSS
ncbi:MAG TPA: YbaK/EbsC family protein [Burkholderiales bacterium]|nr:YbaK/EbsC family protein [Burkholderiales bacterium]